MWKSIGMSLPRHQHPQKSGLSPKLGSFHLRTGVAFWKGEMSAKPKLAFGESSCAQMTNRLKMGCSLQGPWMVGQKTHPQPPFHWKQPPVPTHPPDTGRKLPIPF